MHPLLQVLAGLLGLAAFAALFFFGLVFFAIFAGIALVAGLALWLRLRWLMWRAGASSGGVERGHVPPMGERTQGGSTFEGEFVVIEREREAPADD